MSLESIGLDKKSLRNILFGLFIGIILLFFWILFIDLAIVIDHLKSIKFSYRLFFLSIIFYILAYFFRSARWRIILSQQHPIKYITSFVIYVACMLINFFFPLRAGDLARCIILKKLASIKISQSLPSVFLDKAMDIFPIIIILLLIPLFSINLSPTLYILISIIILIFLLVFLILLILIKWTKSILNILRFFISKIPERFSQFREKAYDSLHYFFDGVLLFFKDKKIIFLVIIFTFLCIIADALFLYFFFLGFQKKILFLKVLFGYTLIQLSYILPYPPAQIGSNEILWVLIFSVTFGIDKNFMSAITISAHIWVFLFHISAGSLALFLIFYRIKNKSFSLKEIFSRSILSKSYNSNETSYFDSNL